MTKQSDARELVERPSGAIESLTTDQRQLDMDGCMVGVSRQAVDEVLAYVSRLEADAARREEMLKEVDDLLEEYGIDTIGTGGCPAEKEQRRVDGILERASNRCDARLQAALAPARTPEDET